MLTINQKIHNFLEHHKNKRLLLLELFQVLLRQQ